MTRQVNKEIQMKKGITKWTRKRNKNEDERINVLHCAVLTRRLRRTSSCLSTAPGKYPNCASITAVRRRRRRGRR
jgi:hypothetical protein